MRLLIHIGAQMLNLRIGTCKVGITDMHLKMKAFFLWCQREKVVVEYPNFPGLCQILQVTVL